MSDSATNPAYRKNLGAAVYLVAMLSATSSESFYNLHPNSLKATTSRCPVPDSHAPNCSTWMAEVKQRIEALHSENRSWKSAFHLSDMVLLSLTEANLKPDRVILSGDDDGISFYFFRPNGYALIQCLESKEIIALEKEEDSQKQRVWEVPPDAEAIREATLHIRSFTTRRFHEHSPSSFDPS